MRLVIRALFVSLVVFLISDQGAGFALARRPLNAAAASKFVQVCGARLCIGTKTYYFVGLNIYNANSRDNCWYPMGYNDGTLDSSLTAIGAGQDAFRAWFYQPLAITAGSRDWSAFDHTISVAAAHNQRVIVTLTDEWGSCDGIAGRKTVTWYENGYQAVEAGMTATYRAYVQEVVTRYRTNPTILMWQLVNEAEAPLDSTGACDEPRGMTALRSFADDMGALVKAADPNHLLSLGTGSGGQCGVSNTDWGYVHASPNIDLTEYHIYGPVGVNFPGDQWNGLRERLTESASLGKPLFVGEVGINVPADVPDVTARRDDFKSKMDAWFAAGIVGALPWAWNNGAAGHPVAGYDIGPGDPTLALLVSY
jgi:mannan endo-1,4-beta-mannosidase